MNWVSFLEQRGIEFVDRGPSTSKDNIYVACPFCGDADHGHHMGISLKGSGWGCWRNTTHRGRNPAKLVQALLRCSWEEANSIAGRGGRVVSGLRGIMDRLQGKVFSDTPKALVMPEYFKPLVQENSPHWNYFRGRGFKHQEIEDLSEKFDLRMVWGGMGLWSWRIIIPVYNEDGDLVTWTARSISDKGLRYRTLTADPAKAEEDKLVAIHPISDCLLGVERLFTRKKILVVVEGPFDCMRMALEEDQYPVHVTCLFGKGVSEAQRDLLIRLRPFYDDVYLLLDPDASLDSLRVISDLRAVNVALFRLRNADDPGDLRSFQVREIFEQMLDQVSDN